MESPAKLSTDATSPDATLAEGIESLRRERDTLLDRQRRICELVKCTPERLEHDVRNLINELQLLRTIFQQQERDEASK